MESTDAACPGITPLVRSDCKRPLAIVRQTVATANSNSENYQSPISKAAKNGVFRKFTLAIGDGLSITSACKRALARNWRNLNTPNRPTAFAHWLIRPVPESGGIWRFRRLRPAIGRVGQCTALSVILVTLDQTAGLDLAGWDGGAPTQVRLRSWIDSIPQGRGLWRPPRNYWLTDARQPNQS